MDYLESLISKKKQVQPPAKPKPKPSLDNEPSSTNSVISIKAIEELKRKLTSTMKDKSVKRTQLAQSSAPKRDLDPKDVKHKEYVHQSKATHSKASTLVGTSSGGSSRGPSESQAKQSKVRKPCQCNIQPRGEPTEEEKQEIIKMLRMNENIGFLTALKKGASATESKQEEAEYDPLELKPFRQVDIPSKVQDLIRQTKGEGSSDALVSVTTELRKRQGQTTDPREIERMVERERQAELKRKQLSELQEDSQAAARSKEQYHRKVHSGNPEKERKPNREEQMREELRLQEIKIRELKQQLEQQDKQKKQHSQSQQREKQHTQSSGYFKQPKQHMKYDPETYETRPHAKIVDIKDSRHLKGQYNNREYIANGGHQHSHRQREEHETRKHHIRKRTPPRLNILRDNEPRIGKKRRRSYSDEEEEEEESDLSDFIVSDNDEGHSSIVKKELSKIKSRYGPKQVYDEGSSSDMEAGYDDILQEEKRAEKIARKEDAEELRRIKQDEEEERLERKMRKRQRIE